MDAARDLWEPKWKPVDFTNERIHLRVIDLLARAFNEGVTGRPGVRAFAVFEFRVLRWTPDGNARSTARGEKEAEKLDRIAQGGAEYLIRDFREQPFDIDVPMLTRKERLYLEGAMPSKDYSKVRSAG